MLREKPRVLITGSSGHLGATIARLLASEYSITGLDVHKGQWTTHVGSVADRRLLFRLVQDVDAVIHTAALHPGHFHDRSREAFVDTNIKGTLHLLEASAKAGVRRFVYTSSTSVYGAALEPEDRAVWVTETLVPQPRDIYDISKLAAEQLCLQMAQSHGLSVVCLRLGRFAPEPPELQVIYRLYRGIDLRDAALAHRLALTCPNIDFDVFNIAALSPFAEHDTAELLADARPVILRYFPEAQLVFSRMGWQLPSQIDRVYVIEKAQQVLGYQPEHNFAQMLQHLGALELAVGG